MEYIKPSWKEKAEQKGDSLPGFWNMKEVEQELNIGNGYGYRLCKKHGLFTYKIGQVRFLKEKDFIWLTTNFEKR